MDATPSARTGPPPPHVLAVHARAVHAFSKDAQPRIELLPGAGVAGDAHCGETVRHRSRVARDPTQPNLRQVHLLHAELLEDLQDRGFDVRPGQLGENLTTSGLPLLALSQGTLLAIGPQAVVRVTGLRNPCAQIESFRPGLLAAVLDRAADGSLVRKAGIMGVVVAGGPVHPGDTIAIAERPDRHVPLQPV